MAKRKDIWRLAQPKSEGGDGQGWDHANRRERYETLKDEQLNGPAAIELQLPIDDAKTPDTEHCYLTEREMWWLVNSTTDEQKARKETCTDWLVARRQQIWHDGEGDCEANPDNKP